MRAFAFLAAVYMITVASAAMAAGSPPQSVEGVAPKEERACLAPGITRPTPLGSHAISEDDYPDLSERNGEQGNVEATFLIHEDGTVSNPIIIRSSGFPRLDEATSKLVAQWRYNPARDGGTTISCRQIALVAWRLTDTQNSVDGDLQFLPPELLGVRGQTTFWVSLDESGNVVAVRVLMSSGDPQLDAAGVRFLKAERFTAPQMNGKPMQSAIPIDVMWSPGATNGHSQSHQ